MALSKLALRPGVVTEISPTKNEGGWSTSNNVRFFLGQLQKYGGWTRLIGVPALVGTCRSLFGWADYVGTAYLAAGTTDRLYVITGGTLTDISPRVHQTNETPDLTTSAGSSRVQIKDPTTTVSEGDWVEIQSHTTIDTLVLFGSYKITKVLSASVFEVDAGKAAVSSVLDGGVTAQYFTTAGTADVIVFLANHGYAAGDIYNAKISTSVGGSTISGAYVIQSITDANRFVIPVSTPASASTSGYENNGQIRISYYLPSGLAVNTAQGGWGVGDWGADDWGLSTAETASILVKLRTWSLGQFGQDLIASPDLGPIYNWHPPDALTATVLPNSPSINRIVFCMSQVQMVISVGSEVNGAHYPTLIRWCDSGNFEDWVASATNQAGSYQLPTGSFCTAALAFELGALIWTDSNLWAMTYLGSDLVFGFQPIGFDCPSISKKAPVTFPGGVVWPSDRGFFRYAGGSVTTVDCPVWSFLFDNIDLTQAEKLTGGSNTLFSEISWWFPIADSDEGGVVKLNYGSGDPATWVWDVSRTTRTAWADRSPFGNPVGADGDGVLYYHEVGLDADSQPMLSFAESGYYDIGDGDQFQYLDVVIPDFQWDGSNPRLKLSIMVTDEPGSAPKVKGPFTVTPTTKRINLSVRGRQIAFKIQSEDFNSWWRLQAIRFNITPAGAM